MIGRRAIVGLSLLSALLFCALAAQSASAAAHTSENTTAFTCVPGGGNLDFKDAHCDETVTPGTGEYGHKLIPEGVTEFEVSNEKTANKTTEAAVATLKYSFKETHFDCTSVNGTGTIENGGTGTDHKVSGALTLEFSKCTVKQPLNCNIKQPIKVEATFMGVDELNGAEKNMGLEFAAKGANFTEITFEGEKCALKGKTFPITGAMIATGGIAGNAKETGATWVFSPEKEMESLKLGTEACEFSWTLTARMKGGGNPISLTTTT